MNRSIHLPEAIALYITAILGSGILFLSASTATVAGPASIFSWMIMILFSFPLAYTFAALSRSYPDAGGAATFTRMAFGQHVGNLVGWFYFLTAAVGQMIVSLTGANYIGTTFDLSAVEIALIACFILFIGGLSNHFGIRISGKMSLVLSILLLILLCIAIVVTLPYVRWDHFQPFAPKGWYPVGTAVIMVFWSFFGWEAICSLADRFKHPEKDLVRSALISAMVIGIVFLLLSFITIGSGTYGNLESDSSPIGVMINRALGFGAQLITAILALIVCTGTVNAFVASLAQLGYALSRDQAFPSWFYYLNPRTETPTRVVWLVVIFAGFGVILSTFLKVRFTQLLFIPNSLGICVYILSMAAALKLYNRSTKPWISSLISLIVLGLSGPFLGLHILVPAVVSGVYFLYNKAAKKYWIKIIHNTEKEEGNEDST
ncbi:APC family permease [Paenactinomyces guangxiensis]|uniref:Amino acid permease n=1 Tax=Paenactinomyces guangxiensis TaxID=1490290 RepID=A0A7W1WR14_9BACL|nr:amino acid permease [Paenactinomyces guangxiensis]MBA4494291.1 amino acid permease [Paenactinomyces guangxiensis]MBH8590785.1 amino acid permease [Paenactinomyces guangxiensis]